MERLMIKKYTFLLLFLLANIKFFDIILGIANLNILPALQLYAIVLLLIVSVWLLFPPVKKTPCATCCCC